MASDIVQFELNRPVEVALRFAEPKIIESQYDPDGRAMYSLADGRVMFHDLLTAERIRALGVGPEEPFFIVKRKNGRQTEYAVSREAMETPARHKPVPAHARAERLPEIVAARNASNNLERQLQASLDQVAARKPAGEQPDGTFAVPKIPPRRDLHSAAAAPAPAQSQAQPSSNGNSTRPRERWTEILLAQTNALTDVLAEALRHAAEHGGIVKSEDVRSVMLSAFINLSKRQEGSRAA